MKETRKVIALAIVLILVTILALPILKYVLIFYAGTITGFMISAILTASKDDRKE